jgi:hypothetical protein
MFCRVGFASCVLLLVTKFFVSALPEQGVYLPAVSDSGGGNGSNGTIAIGYFVDSEQRIAAIGMAIQQAQVDGLLPGYSFK